MDNSKKNKLLMSACACCGYFTIAEMKEICPVCFWEEDFFQEQHANDDSGPNAVSLINAKENYKNIGVIEERFKDYVRLPKDSELKPDDYQAGSL